jgi:AcrR family transcriptional regulator
MGQLMEAAERLFAQKGVAGTSLQELADAIGVTRTGIYHYVSGKDEMLRALVEGFTLKTAKDLEVLVKSTASPAVQRLHEGVTQMALRIAQSPQRFRLLLTAEGALPETLAKQYRSARRRTLAALEILVSQAIKEGSCKPVDPKLASFSLLGSCNWVAFWYPRAEGLSAKTPEDVADGLANIALGGLLTDRPTPEVNGLAHMIGLLREDIDRLEHMIETG